MTLNTTARPRTGPRVPAGRCLIRGRTSGTSTRAVTSWRTATTPTGPIMGKARAPSAAPDWFEAELVSSSATPRRRSGSVVGSMARTYGSRSHSTSATFVRAIRFGHGYGLDVARAPLLRGRRPLGVAHRSGDRAARVAGGR